MKSPFLLITFLPLLIYGQVRNEINLNNSDSNHINIYQQVDPTQLSSISRDVRRMSDAVIRSSKQAIEEKEGEFSPVYAKLIKELKPLLEKNYLENDRKITNLLETFKNKTIGTNNFRNAELASVCYLLSNNEFVHSRYSRALSQVNEAVYYDSLEAMYLMSKGQILIEMYKLDEAPDNLFRALSITSNDTLKARIYGLISSNFGKLNNYTEAKRYAQMELRLLEKMFPDKEILVQKYVSIAHIHTKSGDSVSTLNSLNEAMRVANKIGDSVLAENYLSAARFFRYYFSDPVRTLYNLKMGQNVADKFCPKSTILGAIYGELGSHYNFSGREDSAIFFYNKSIQHSNMYAPNRDELVATSYINMGQDYQSRREYDKAIENGKLSLAILENNQELNNSIYVYDANYLIAMSYEGQMRWNDALPYLKNIVALYRQLGYEPDYLENIYFEMAFVYTCLDDQLNALDCLKKINQSDLNKIQWLNYSGTAGFQMERYNEAIHFFDLAHHIALKSQSTVGDITYLAIYSNLAFANCYTANPNLAKEYLDKFRNIYSRLTKSEQQLNADLYKNTLTNKNCP